MPIPILMPALSPTMTEGNLVIWHKKEGEAISPGTVLADIETDKATMEVESVDSGVLARILVPAGTTGVQVNTLIGVLLEEGETAQDLENFLAERVSATPPATSSRADEDRPMKIEKNEGSAPLNGAQKPSLDPHAPQSGAQDDGKEGVSGAQEGGKRESTKPQPRSPSIKSSPLARRMAAELGIDLDHIQGSGPRGRVVLRDVEAAQMNPARVRHSKPDQRMPLTTMRQVIAARLTAAKQEIPHFYMEVECAMSAVMELRAQINAGDKARKISLNDFVIAAAAVALQEVPEANASWQGDAILQQGASDIAVAVTVEGGLYTPVIRGAELKSLAEISDEMRALATKAKAGTLKPAEFQGGSLTISNLGMYGVKAFYAIVNPPAASILAVGAVEDRVVPRGGAAVIEPMMTCTLAVDHRVMDGKVAADLLNAFKVLMETPALLFYQMSTR